MFGEYFTLTEPETARRQPHPSSTLSKERGGEYLNPVTAYVQRMSRHSFACNVSLLLLQAWLPHKDGGTELETGRPDMLNH